MDIIQQSINSQTKSMSSAKILPTALCSAILALVVSLSVRVAHSCGHDEYYRWASAKCKKCTYKIDNCETCSNSWGDLTCNSCYPNSGKENSYKCTLCEDLVCVGCNKCNDNANPGQFDCTNCEAGFYLTINATCKRICSSTDCEDCPNDANQCTKCNQGFHLLTVNDSCTPCTSNCKLCPNNPEECTQCSLGFKVHTDQTCKRICSSTDCEDCPNDANQCTKCNQGFHLLTVNDTCTPCTISDCKNCPNNTNKCFQCFTGFYLQSDQNCKRICNSTDCFYCPNDADQCTNCKSGFHLLTVNDTCTPCTFIGCLQCPNNVDECTICSKYLQLLPNQTCVETCGDSLVVNFTCDLPLGIANDGCTDQCEIEEGYNCSVTTIGYLNKAFYGTQILKKSRCWFDAGRSKNFIKFISSDKDSYRWENRLSMIFQIEQQFPLSQNDKILRKLFAFNDSEMSIEAISFDESTLRLALTVAYSDDIDGRPYSLLFRPSADVDLIYSGSPTADCKDKISHNSPTLKVIYYSEDLFTVAKAIMFLSMVVCALAVIACAVAAFSPKLSGLELIFVAQYTWLMILWIPSYLPLPIYMTNYLRFTSGYNYPFASSTDISAAPQTFVFGLSDQSFASNYNLILLFTVVPLLFVISSKIVCRHVSQTDQQKMHERYRNSLQILMYGCFFSLQYFVSCTVIHFKSKNLFDLLSLSLIALQLCIYAGTAIRFIYKSASFNRFRLQFRDTQLKYNHYAFHLVNLVASVLLLSLLPNYPWAPAMPQLLLLAYTLINAPYKTTAENSRSIFYLLLMLNATAFKMYIYQAQPDHHSIGQYVWLILIQLTLIVGVGWAAYEVYEYWKDKYNTKKIRKEIMNRFIEENKQRHRMNMEQKGRAMLCVIPRDQTVLEYLQGQSDYGDSSEVMRQKAREKGQKVTDEDFDFKHINQVSPLKRLQSDKKLKNQGNKQQYNSVQPQPKHQELIFKDEQKKQLRTILKETKTYFGLQNAIEQGNRLKEYNNPLFVEKYNEIGQESEISSCKSIRRFYYDEQDAI